MPLDARVYRFDRFLLDSGERHLLAGGEELVLRPKAFDTLLYLVRHHGHVVSKADLLDALWPDTSISDAVLTHCIAEVRSALGDDPRDPRFIRTLSKHGYKFVADVDVVLGGDEEAADDRDPGTAPAAPVLAAPDVAPTPPPTAIVVLPFANISGDPENEYFCDGLSEELINGLTKVGSLQVVAHTSSFAFKKRDVDAREIGRQLNVGTILEGSVRKTGDRLRISAQLIDAARGFHLWCEQYDRRLEDVFVIQDEIAKSILEALRVQFLHDPLNAPLLRRTTANLEAYDLYLRGRAFWHQRFNGCLQRAMDCFSQAISKDPGYALAYSGLADSLSTLGLWGFVAGRDVFPKATALAETALRLDENLAEGHASRAVVNLFWDFDWSGGERRLARALELNPGCALLHTWLGHYLSMVGRMEESIVEMKRAQALDPVSPVCSSNVGWTLYLAHQQERAVSELRAVLGRAPDNPMALMYLAYALVELGRHDEALGALARAQALSGGMPFCAEGMAMAHAGAGRLDEVRRIQAETETRSKSTYVMESTMAVIHLALGEHDAMFHRLDRAVLSRDPLLPWLKFMPPFDPFREHPRFKAVLRAIGLE